MYVLSCSSDLGTLNPEFVRIGILHDEKSHESLDLNFVFKILSWAGVGD